MNPTPLISVIMPAFNVEKYISEAIESVLSQDFGDFELIVADDCSTDNTAAIINSFSLRDSRVIYTKTPRNSGRCMEPRILAASLGHGKLLATIDADDIWDEGYLRKLVERREATGADMVLSTMWTFSEGFPPMRFVPDFKFDLSAVIGGHEAALLTTPKWEIGMNGILADREKYLEEALRLPLDNDNSFIVEYLSRMLLERCEKIAFCDARYFYRENETSVTHAPRASRHSYLLNDILLYHYYKDRDGTDSDGVTAANCAIFSHTVDVIRSHRDSPEPDPEEYAKAEHLIRKAYKEIDFRLIKGKVGPRYYALMRLGLPLARPLLRLLDNDTVKQSFRKLLLNPLYHGRRNARRILDYFSLLREVPYLYRNEYMPHSQNYEFFRKYYSDNGESAGREGIVVVCDGSLFHGGPTDRLRGILTTYEQARKRNIPFYISWTSPFPLENYLVPAKVDWRIPKNEISHNSRHARPLIIEDVVNSQSYLRLRAMLHDPVHQIHVFTNGDNARGRYRALYEELFQPSPEVAKEVGRHLTAIGAPYYAFTFRFLQLLGDFNDWYQRVLSPEEARELIAAVDAELLNLIEKMPRGYRVLVTSDSKLYLEHVRNLDGRIYVVPGDVKNVDLLKGDFPQAWLKTFVDQQLLMHASKVYLMRTGEMFRSGFPRFAAEIGGVPFEDHKF